jgi:lipopolysaccharide export system protein LptA
MCSKMKRRTEKPRGSPATSRVFLAALVVAGGMIAAHPVEADSFRFSADSVRSSSAKGRERTTLAGNATIVSDTTTILADRIEMYGTDFQFADCSGTVSVKDEEKGIFLTTTTLFYDRKKKISRAQGPTTMEDKKHKVVIKGNVLENDDDNETTIVQVGVRVLKENMAARAEYAFYHRKDTLLELSGTPVVYRDGDQYNARRIIINTDTNEITLEGEVSGSVVQTTDKSKQKTKDEAAGAGKTGPNDGETAAADGASAGSSTAGPPQPTADGSAAPGTPPASNGEKR